MFYKIIIFALLSSGYVLDVSAYQEEYFESDTNFLNEISKFHYDNVVELAAEYNIPRKSKCINYSMIKLNYLKKKFILKVKSCASGKEKYSPSICMPMTSDQFNQLCYELYEEAANCIKKLSKKLSLPTTTALPTHPEKSDAGSIHEEMDLILQQMKNLNTERSKLLKSTSDRLDVLNNRAANVNSYSELASVNEKIKEIIEIEEIKFKNMTETYKNLGQAYERLLNNRW